MANEHLAAEGLDPARARVVEGNFFTWQDDKGAFDCGYDYTFM